MSNRVFKKVFGGGDELGAVSPTSEDEAPVALFTKSKKALTINPYQLVSNFSFKIMYLVVRLVFLYFWSASYYYCLHFSWTMTCPSLRRKVVTMKMLLRLVQKKIRPNQMTITPRPPRPRRNGERNVQAKRRMITMTGWVEGVAQWTRN